MRLVWLGKTPDSLRSMISGESLLVSRYDSPPDTDLRKNREHSPSLLVVRFSILFCPASTLPMLA